MLRLRCLLHYCSNGHDGSSTTSLSALFIAANQHDEYRVACLGSLVARRHVTCQALEESWASYVLRQRSSAVLGDQRGHS